MNILYDIISLILIHAASQFKNLNLDSISFCSCIFLSIFLITLFHLVILMTDLTDSKFSLRTVCWSEASSLGMSWLSIAVIHGNRPLPTLYIPWVSCPSILHFYTLPQCFRGSMRLHVLLHDICTVYRVSSHLSNGAVVDQWEFKLSPQLIKNFKSLPHSPQSFSSFTSCMHKAY